MCVPRRATPGALGLGWQICRAAGPAAASYFELTKFPKQARLVLAAEASRPTIGSVFSAAKLDTCQH